MLTRGKVHNISDGANYQDCEDKEDDEEKLNDDNSSEKNSYSSKDRPSERRESFRSSSAHRVKRTPSADCANRTPILKNQHSSRSSSRRGCFITDVSSEDTPLSKRQMLNAETKKKRLILVNTVEALQEAEAEAKLNSTEESHDEDINIGGQRKYSVGESEAEKQDDGHDGVRRSQRAKRQIYANYNDSWIFTERTVKGYPAIKEGDNTKEGNRRRSKRRNLVEKPEEDEEGDDDIEDEENESRDARQINMGRGKSMNTSRNKGKKKSNASRYATSDNQDMYTEIKNRRLRSSGTSSRPNYSGYSSTVINAKKTPARIKRHRRPQYASSDESETKTETESPSEDEQEEPPKGKRREEMSDHSRDPDNEEADVPVPAVDGERVKGKYTLRKIQPIDRYCPVNQKSRNGSPSRSHSTRHTLRMACSPAHRAQRKRRQKAQNDSTTSDSSSSDEERFERRKNKSMSKARNRCLPMNFSPDDLMTGVVKDRMKIGSSLADVDPMKVDREVTFEQVGGLETYVRSLKEMVLFPLLYPEVFEKYSIQPPRGVLFYGPPGTGKTLVARCLANECSQNDRRVAFFMRKGADCLSKWVGESERQLRLLFDQAYQMRPSIIFFDEIDGLAPVRSTRQDQIHSSIVSTLLALMDGLDSRGEVIIIGATNRLDAIDPALRRPGRFDREFHFPLPSLPARKEILDIHLKTWTPAPAPSLVQYLSQRTVGYCGADLKSLCAEAALLALRRRYPQVYNSREKLLLDLSQINVERRDFEQAVQRLVPASQRSATASGKPLSSVMSPLLDNLLQQLIKTTQLLFPEGIATLKLKGPLSGIKKQTSNQIFPRLLILGDCCSHITSALLHYMERLPVHRLDLSTLHGLSARSPEEACVQLFQEARRNVPAIIYLPLVSRWWLAVGETVRATFLTQLSELDPELPIFLLVTNDTEIDGLPEDLSELFHEEDEEIFNTKPFTVEERKKFFRPLILQKCLKPPLKKKTPKSKLEVLPLAPAPPPRQLNEKEKEQLERKEEATLRELRIFLREILAKMARNKLFYMFTRPVDINEVPDYLQVIQKPMDLETMMTKIDQHAYESAKDFLTDIEQICANALEYNPDKNPEDKMIRHRACTLRDTAYALIKAEMDTDFEEQCQEISRIRKIRKNKIAPIAAPLPLPEPVMPNITSSLDNKGNGEASKLEIKVAKAKNKKSCWSHGIIKSAAKKRKAEVENESLLSNDSLIGVPEKIQENGVDGDVQEASDCDGPPDLVEDATQNDSQASDAFDSQPEIESEAVVPPATVSKKSVIINVDDLESLLDAIATKTENWNLEKLLRLYSKLSKLIDRYMKLWDRKPLIEEMKQLLSTCR